MSKKPLKEKIILICWWALGLTILYFLIGAWLISDGPKFDPTKTYNLLKDTLTLGAAFLAPVVAFVLFSDWREPYLAEKTDEIQTTIYALEFEIRKQLHLMRMDYLQLKSLHEDFRSKDLELFEKLNTFKNNIKRLQRLGFGESEYYLNSNKLHNLFRELKQDLVNANYYKGDGDLDGTENSIGLTH